MTDPHDILGRPLVVGLTADASSTPAVRRACDLSERFGAPLEIVHAVPEARLVVAGLTTGAPTLDDAQRSRIRQALETRLLPFSLTPTQLEDVLRIDAGSPARVLVEHARRIDAGVIIVGQRAPSSAMDLSSTARALMSHAPCCVWRQLDPALPIHRVLVPVDMSEGSRHAVRVAGHLARRMDATLHMLHAHPEPPPSEGPLWGDATLEEATDPAVWAGHQRAAAQEQFEAFVEQVTPEGVGTSHEFVEASPVAAILSHQLEVDLIVMGTQGRGKLSAALLGSVTYAVLRHSVRPVLAVPHPADLEQRGTLTVDTFHVTA